MTTLPAMTDIECEDLIGWADGRWHDSEYRIDASDLMNFVRHVAAARDAQWQAAVDAAVMQERAMCATICAQRAQLQAIRASVEGNDYATERASEANGCAAAIRARTKEKT